MMQSPFKICIFYIWPYTIFAKYICLKFVCHAYDLAMCFGKFEARCTNDNYYYWYNWLHCIENMILVVWLFAFRLEKTLWINCITQYIKLTLIEFSAQFFFSEFQPKPCIRFLRMLWMKWSMGIHECVITLFSLVARTAIWIMDL